MRLTIYQSATIALLGVIAGGLHAAFHKPIDLKPAAPPPLVLPSGTQAPPAPTGAGAEGPAPSTAAPASADAPRTLGLEITAEDAWPLFQAGAAFIDARNRDEFLAGHVQGAYWLPSSLFYEGRPDALNFLAPDQVLIIYCGGGACDASHNTARLLQQAGFARTHIMKDGYPAWQTAGRPVAAGPPEYESMLQGSGTSNTGGAP